MMLTQDLPDYELQLRFWEMGTKIVPPKNIKQGYCLNLEI